MRRAGSGLPKTVDDDGARADTNCQPRVRSLPVAPSHARERPEHDYQKDNEQHQGDHIATRYEHHSSASAVRDHCGRGSRRIGPESSGAVCEVGTERTAVDAVPALRGGPRTRPDQVALAREHRCLERGGEALRCRVPPKQGDGVLRPVQRPRRRVHLLGDLAGPAGVGRTAAADGGAVLVGSSS